MTASGPCPRIGCAGFLTRLLGTVGWLRCGACNQTYDDRGYAYDSQWRPVFIRNR